MQMPEDLNKHYKVSIYPKGIKLNKTKNIAVKVSRRGDSYTIYYFDDNEIYQKILVKNYFVIDGEKKIALSSMSLDGLCIYPWGIVARTWDNSCDLFEPIGCNGRNNFLDKKIINELKVGDHVSKLHEIAATKYLKEFSPVDYSDFDQKFHSVSKPIVIGNNSSFEYIKLSVNCASSVVKEDIIKYKKDLDKWVLDKLSNSRSFIKYGVPVGILHISNLVLTKDKRVEYTFEIKPELRALYNCE